MVIEVWILDFICILHFLSPTIMSLEEKYILALNVGSTSIKSRVFLSRKGEINEIFTWSKANINPKNGHKKVFPDLYKKLRREDLIEKITAVGHRVVHGGQMKGSVRVGVREKKIIEEFIELAPLHNPYNLDGIAEAEKWVGKKVPQVAVFDTAFYSKLPEYASVYAIPAKYTKRYKLYRYGFHGISHSYSVLEAAKLLKRPVKKLKLITVHLGGGSSITAVDKGVAVDTSMGFTPLEGLVMGTRSGDIDPGIIFYLADRAKLSIKEIKYILVNESGLYGLSGAKNMLELLDRVKKKDKEAVLAYEVYTYRIRKYIGAYTAVLGGCDGIVFTGAVGSGDRLTRDSVAKSLKNHILKNVPIMLIKPNEEKMIAQETGKLIFNF